MSFNRGGNAMDNSFINHYKVLGVPEYASGVQIKLAYFAMNRLINRDQTDENKSFSNTKFNPYQILESYEALSTIENRRKFDWQLREIRAQNPDYSHQSRLELKPVIGMNYCEKLYWCGVEALDNGDSDKALIEFHKLLKFEKGNPLIMNLIAKAYQLNGSISYAVKSARCSVEFEPENEENHLFLGRIYEAMGRLRTARRYYKNAFKINPNNPRCHDQFARGNLILERLDKSLTWLARSFFPSPNSRSFHIEDGLLKVDHVVNFMRRFSERLSPLPNSLTFRYTGIW